MDTRKKRKDKAKEITRAVMDSLVPTMIGLVCEINPGVASFVFNGAGTLGEFQEIEAGLTELVSRALDQIQEEKEAKDEA